MSRRRLASCLAVILAAVLTPRPASSAPGTHPASSGQTQFNRAMARLGSVPHVEYKETDNQIVGGPKPRFTGFRYNLRFSAPDRIWVLEQTQIGRGWRLGAELRQVGRRRCVRISTWVCSPAPKPNVAQLVAARLLGTASYKKRFRTVPVTLGSGGHRYAGQAIHFQGKIRAAGQPFQIQFGKKTVVVRQYDYAAVLDERAANGLPIAFSSTVTVGGHVFMRKRGAFSYTAHFTINLPRMS